MAKWLRPRPALCRSGPNATCGAEPQVLRLRARRDLLQLAIVVPGTLRDSLFLLAVVLEQQTELNPTEIMTDTGAYTDVVFGLFWLLGYRFSPRLGDIGGATTGEWILGPTTGL